MGSQVVSAYEVNRQAFNAWLRDGAPLNSTTFVPVAVGTSAAGTVRSNSTSHPLKSFIEVADSVETARNSGVWRPAARIVTDCSIVSGARTLISVTAAFTQSDLGTAILIGGAGAAGAALTARIDTVTDSQHATWSTANTSGATASGQSLGIGIYTTDGTHPTTTGDTAIASGINAALL